MASVRPFLGAQKDCGTSKQKPTNQINTKQTKPQNS